MRRARGNAMKDDIRSKLQHRLNPLHVYCRLREAGMKDKKAKKVSSLYERLIYRPVLS